MAVSEDAPGATRPRGISAVVVNWNGRRLLPDCLGALEVELAGADAEIIVVDNASTDGSPDWVRDRHPAVVVIEAATNTGFAAGCNAGARAARFDVLAFVNADAVVQPGWRAPLEDALRGADDVVLAGGLALFRGDPELVNSAGIRVGRSCAGTDIGFELPLRSMELHRREVAAVSGVSLAADAAWFLDTGGFDEAFFMYFEDVELGLRAWLEGRRVVFVPESVVLHEFGGSAGSRYSPIRNHYASRNRLLSAFRLLEGRALAVSVTLSLMQDAAVLAVLGIQRDWPRLRAALRGKVSGNLAGVGLGVLRRRRRALRRSSRARFTRTSADLVRLGLIDSLPTSLREFARFRQL